MEKIDASVGIAGKKQCYNVPKDQEAIQRLLVQIPVSQGGCMGQELEARNVGHLRPRLG